MFSCRCCVFVCLCISFLYVQPEGPHDPTMFPGYQAGPPAVPPKMVPVQQPRPFSDIGTFESSPAPTIPIAPIPMRLNVRIFVPSWRFCLLMYSHFCRPGSNRPKYVPRAPNNSASQPSSSVPFFVQRKRKHHDDPTATRIRISRSANFLSSPFHVY